MLLSTPEQMSVEVITASNFANHYYGIRDARPLTDELGFDLYSFLNVDSSKFQFSIFPASLRQSTNSLFNEKTEVIVLEFRKENDEYYGKVVEPNATCDGDANIVAFDVIHGSSNLNYPNQNCRIVLETESGHHIVIMSTVKIASAVFGIRLKENESGDKFSFVGIWRSFL